MKPPWEKGGLLFFALPLDRNSFTVQKQFPEMEARKTGGMLGAWGVETRFCAGKADG